MGLKADAAVEDARALALDALNAGRGIDPIYAVSVCDRAVVLLTPLGASETLADVLRWKGSILRDSGQHAAASDCYAESLGVADAISYKLGRAHALNCFGTIAQCRSELKAARRWYRSAQRLAGELGDRRLLGMIEQNLGVIAATEGEWADALTHFQTALASFEIARDKPALIWVLNNLGRLYTRERFFDAASHALDRALRIAAELGDGASEAIVEENRSRLFLATGDLDEAEEAATRALGMASQRGDGTREAAALHLLARIRRLRDRSSPDVVAILNRALQLAQSGEDRELKVDILRELAYTCEDCDQVTRASEYRRAAQKLAGGDASQALIGLSDIALDSASLRPT